MITMRMSAGRLKKAETGRYAGRNIAYGCRVVNGEYVQMKEEAEIVKRIFRLRRKPRYGRVISYQKVAEQLNSQGVKAPGGKQW